MMPLIHFLMAYIISSIFTKNITLRRLAAIGGLAPDIDGLFILFDAKAYYLYHHTIFHPLLGGALLGIIFAAIFRLYGKRKGGHAADFKKYFVFFIIGILVHDLGDIIGTNWPIKFLFPLPVEFSIYPLLSSGVIYGIINPLFAMIFILAAIVQMLIEKKSIISVFSEKTDRKIIEILFRNKKHN